MKNEKDARQKVESLFNGAKTVESESKAELGFITGEEAEGALREKLSASGLTVLSSIRVTSY